MNVVFTTFEPQFPHFDIAIMSFNEYTYVNIHRGTTEFAQEGATHDPASIHTMVDFR